MSTALDPDNPYFNQNLAWESEALSQHRACYANVWSALDAIFCKAIACLKAYNKSSILHIQAHGT